MVVALSALVAAGVSALRSGTDDRPWHEAAEELGLSFLRSMPKAPRPRLLRGEIDGCSVAVYQFKQTVGGISHIATRFEVGHPGLPPEIGIGSERFRSELDDVGPPIEIGDPDFDQVIKLRGDEGLLLARLDRHTRRAVEHLVDSDGAYVLDTFVACEDPEAIWSATRVVKRVRRMVDVATRLGDRRHTTHERIAMNAERDPLPAVRLRNLLFLIVNAPNSPATADVARDRLSDTSPDVRLAAADHLGVDGAGTMRKLFEDPAVADALRGQALARWSNRIDRNEVVEVVCSLLHPSQGLLAFAALRVAERMKLHEVSSALVSLAAEADVDLAVEATGALAAIGGPDAQQKLIALLEVDVDRIRRAAIKALARMGTLEAVEPLLGHTKGLFKNAELKMYAQQAVEAIQERAGAVGRGTLSVIEEDRGGLAIADEAGGLAITSDEDDSE